MKILEEIKKVIDEYGVSCIGIAIIALMLYAIPWLMICVIWFGCAVFAGFEYSWFPPTIIWIIGMVYIKILKNKW